MRQQSTRKRNNGLRIFRLVIFFGLLLTLSFIFLVSILGNQKFGGLHKMVLEVSGPVQETVASGLRYLHTFKKEYLDILGVKEENKRLWRELRESRALLHQSREALAINARLTRLLDLRDSFDCPVVAATVTGKDPSMWFRSLIIDRGTHDNVFKGSPVTNEDGVVGQVISASPSFSKVLLAIAPSSAIDVLLQKTRVRGILKGTGSLVYTLEYVLKTVEVKKGDVVVTAGYGGIFPTGLSVGVVSRVIRKRRGMFHEIEVTPSVDFKTLEHLLVIRKDEAAP
ncbi:MAG: rod shape-determining protein MreC [Desulfobulbus propionicus]|nr:MAG: rod shape-determining protein MreC [Desulfobulbus propionicus]